MKTFLIGTFIACVLLLGSHDYFTSKELGYNVCEVHVKTCQ